MFQKVDNIEEAIKRQLDQALANANLSGAQSSVDPFMPVASVDGEWFPCKAWGFGAPVKLSRDAFREILHTALLEADLYDKVVEIDTRDSSSFFSVVFESPTAKSKAVMASQAGKFVLKVAGSSTKIAQTR